MRKLKKGLLIGLSLLLSIIVMLYFLQEKLIFLPTKLPADYSYSFEDDFTEFSLDSPDGATLNALHFGVEKPKGVILYFHGNAGDLSRWGTIASKLTKFDHDVVVMDYRGYGKSKGERSETALYADAQLFYNWLLERFEEKDVLIYGRSLGASIATHLAAKNNPHKLILETPFYNLMDVAQERFGFLPLKSILNYKMNSNEYIQKVDCPIYIFHGTADEVVPYESGKKLFEAIPHSDKEFFAIANGAHNNLDEFDAYWKGIKKVLQ